MKRRLVGERVEFQCLGYTRLWFKRGLRHREDGGPAYEYTRPAYEHTSGCHYQWWERGMFIRCD